MPSFDDRYRPLECVALGGGIRTHNAQEMASGRPVTIRRRIVTWRAALAASALIGAIPGCLNDRPVAPDDSGAVRVGLQANVMASAGRTILIRTFYSRVDGTEVTLESSPNRLSVTPGVSQTVEVRVRVAPCLADSQHASEDRDHCQVRVRLTLLDESGATIDEQSSAPGQPASPGQTVTITQPITLAEVGQVTIAPIAALRVGNSRTLTATATDGSGNTLPARAYTWSTDNPDVLAVNPSTGSVVAVNPGTANVTATTGVKSGQATARVLRSVASVVISPDPAPAVRAAATLALVAVARDATGADAGDLSERTITWTATNPSGGARTADVSPNGVVTGVFPGSADITVSIDGVTKGIRLSVTAGAVRVTPSAGQLLVGATLPLQAAVLDANDAPLANVPVAWGTSNASVATVSATGVVTAVAPGQATITATGGGISGTAAVAVGTLSLGLSPANARLLAGEARQYAAAGALATPAWQSSNTNVATVSASGVVTARFPGSTIITATATTPHGTQRGTTTVTVDVAGLSIDPPSAIVPYGDAVQFTAIATDVRGVPIPGVPINWWVSNPQLVSFDQTGLVYGFGEGTVTVFASGGGKQAEASLEIFYSESFRAPRSGKGLPVRPPATTTPSGK